MKLLYISIVFTDCAVAQTIFSFLTSYRMNCSVCYLFRFITSLYYGHISKTTPSERFGIPSMQVYTVTGTLHSEEDQTGW